MESVDETVSSKQQNSSAASPAAAVNGGRQVARFNVSAPFRVSPSPVREVADALDPAGGDRGRRDVSPSRFNVEFVDEVTHADDRPTIGSGGTTAAGHSSLYDTQCQKTFGHNTLETLPHADHYRNLLSATGHIRKRPTLLELHELSVRYSFLSDFLLSHLEPDTETLWSLVVLHKY